MGLCTLTFSIYFYSSIYFSAPPVIDCGFEDCNWQSLSGTFDWKVGRGDEATGTLPTTDISLGTGEFLY